MQLKKYLFSTAAGMAVCVALSSSAFAAGMIEPAAARNAASLCPQETNDPNPAFTLTTGSAIGQPARLDPQEQNSGVGFGFDIFR